MARSFKSVSAFVVLAVLAGLAARPAMTGLSYVAGQDAVILGTVSATAVGGEAVANDDSTAIGMRALAQGHTCVAVGSGAESGADGISNVNIGDDNKVLASDVHGAVAIGRLGKVTSRSIEIGHNGHVRATCSTGIGEDVEIGETHSDSIAIGVSAATTDSSQVMIGASAHPIKRVTIGGGEKNSSPFQVSFLATGGLGTDVPTPDTLYEAGRPTGSAKGGGFVWYTAGKPGTSGMVSTGSQLAFGIGATIGFTSGQIVVLNDDRSLATMWLGFTDDAAVACVVLKAGRHTVEILQDTDGMVSTTLGHAGTWNIAWDGTHYVIECKHPTGRTVRPLIFGA